MSDIRFNNWLHQSGTGGVTQDSSGSVGIGSTLPTAKLDIGGAVKIDAGIVTATTFSGNVTGVAATFSGAVSVGGALTYEDVTNVDSVGVVTARQGIRVGAGKSIGSDSGTVTYYGDGSNLTGIEGNPFTGNVGIKTDNITKTDLVGAGNSFVGMYLGDGFIGFPTYLGRSGGYYITTSINALNAGPVTLGSTMTLDGAWVIV